MNVDGGGGRVSEERLWAVLYQVGLGEYVKKQPLGLDAPIDEVMTRVLAVRLHALW